MLTGIWWESKAELSCGFTETQWYLMRDFTVHSLVEFGTGSQLPKKVICSMQDGVTNS